MNFKTIGITGSTGVLGSYIKNNFGNLNIEKLKHKKIDKGSKSITKNSLTNWSDDKKYKIIITGITVKLSVPSKPSK